LTRARLIEDLRLKQELEQREIIKKCKESPWYWLRNCTETFDEQAAEKQEEPYKPFPDKSYLPVMLDLLNVPTGIQFIPKSREMMASWFVMGYITWQCQFFPRRRWVVQSKDEDTAKGLLEYSKVLYRRQPEWMKKRFPLDGGKMDTDGGKQSNLLHLYANESRVIGITSDPDKIRQGHPTGVFFDEAAHMASFEAAYAAAINCTRRIIALSSAHPGGYFSQVCET
jgi:hypothetical protein